MPIRWMYMAEAAALWCEMLPILLRVRNQQATAEVLVTPGAAVAKEARVVRASSAIWQAGRVHSVDAVAVKISGGVGQPGPLSRPHDSARLAVVNPPPMMPAAACGPRSAASGELEKPERSAGEGLSKDDADFHGGDDTAAVVVEVLVAVEAAGADEVGRRRVARLVP
jgi:hypothetical protein